MILWVAHCNHLPLHSEEWFKDLQTSEALKKICWNLRCQRNALLLAKVSFSLTSITSTHFRQFWETWLTQTLPAVLRLSKQNERLASDDYTMCIVCPCDPPQPRIFLDIPLAVLDSFLGYFVYRSRIPFYVSLNRSDCRPAKNPNRTQKRLLLFYKGDNVNDCSPIMIFSSLPLS